MNINEIIDIIPKLFLYFIPGYIALHIKSHFKTEKESKDSHLLIMSIVISFIINEILDIIVFAINKLICKPIIISDTNKPIFLLVSSIVFGCIWVLYYGSKFEKYINKLLGSNITSEANVWNKAMKAENGAWIRVYLYEQNLLYEGKLLNYTIDPEDNNKEVLLGAFTSYNLESKDIIEEFDDDKKMVLVSCKDISNIEILKD